MRRGVVIARVVTAAALMFSCFSGIAAGAEFDHAALARQSLEHHIRPGYQRLAGAAADLDGALPPYCEQPIAALRKAVEKSFDSVVTAWGRVEHITFGPVAASDRFEKIMFWPDRRGIGARQIANALKARDAGVVDPARIAEKSAAMQGLPALEALLFSGSTDGEAAEARRHRCAFAAAVAANLRRMTSELAAAWADSSDFSKSWLSPGPGNANYLKPSEITFALAKALDQGLEKVRDQRLGGPLGLNPQRRKLPAVLEKSGRTMLLVAANIEGLRELYAEGGMQQAIAATAASDSDVSGLERLVETELQTAKKGVAALVDVPAPFEGAQNVQRVIALGFPLKNARTMATTLLSTAANLPLGFNASDGD